MVTVELLTTISYGGAKRPAGDRLTITALFAKDLLAAGLAKPACDGECPMPEPIKQDDIPAPESELEPEGESEPKTRRARKLANEGID